MFEKHILIIWQPSVNFLTKKWIILKSAIHKVLTLNSHQIKTIDQNSNSKSSWKDHRSIVLRIFWVILIDLPI